MASTYSTSLKLTLIGDGDQAGIWGQTTNTNLGTLLEQAITGVESIVMSDANYTLTSFNGVLDQARNAVLVVTGTNNAVRDLIPPVAEKLYTIVNNTTGGYAIRVIGASGTGVNIPNGTACLVYCNGTNFISGLSGSAGSFTVAGSLAVTSTSNLGGAITYGGVTLSNAVTGTGSMVLSASPTFTGAPLAPTAAPGTNTTQIATTAFALANGIPSGAILLWSGSIASIPSGWVICDGTNGTPNLRDRFVVGAGSTYAVAATGGDANAIVVTHTHTANSAIVDPGHTHGIDVYYLDGGGDRNYVRSSSAVNLTGPAPTQSAVTNITATTTVDSAGSSGTNANLPPYYALAYIMKV
jgi:hypothetical protein